MTAAVDLPAGPSVAVAVTEPVADSVTTIVAAPEPVVIVPEPAVQAIIAEVTAPQPVGANVTAAPDAETKPKKRGWWNLGR